MKWDSDSILAIVAPVCITIVLVIALTCARDCSAQRMQCVSECAKGSSAEIIRACAENCRQ